MVKFHFLTGDLNWLEYGGKWISNKLNNGEFDYWLVLDFINYLDATGDYLVNDNPKNEGDKYIVELRAVSPEQISEHNLKQAIDSYGLPDETKLDDEMLVELIDGYGINAMLWSKQGNNAYKLIREAKQQSQMIDGLFGFYMDCQENRLGQSGWELIRGQTIREFLGMEDTP